MIGQDGKQLGIMPIEDALKKAAEYNLDLVAVSINANPPVCRIMDFGKYRFEQSKREKEARKKQKQITIKEVKVRPNIDEHDYQVKLRNARRFCKAAIKLKQRLCSAAGKLPTRSWDIDFLTGLLLM